MEGVFSWGILTAFLCGHWPRPCLICNRMMSTYTMRQPDRQVACLARYKVPLYRCSIRLFNFNLSILEQTPHFQRHAIYTAYMSHLTETFGVKLTSLEDVAQKATNTVTHITSIPSIIPAL
jgi:hypothetical protein